MTNKLMQFVALAAVLGCFLPTMVTAQPGGHWGPITCCFKGEKAVAFQLYFQDRHKLNETVVVIVLICSHGRRINSPIGQSPGNRGIPGAVHSCRSGRYLTSCRLQRQLPGVTSTPANNLDCRCSDGQTLKGDGNKFGKWQGWSPRCRNGIVGIQTYAGKSPRPFYVYDAKFFCNSCPIKAGEIDE